MRCKYVCMDGYYNIKHKHGHPIYFQTNLSCMCVRTAHTYQPWKIYIYGIKLKAMCVKPVKYMVCTRIFEYKNIQYLRTLNSMAAWQWTYRYFILLQQFFLHVFYEWNFYFPLRCIIKYKKEKESRENLLSLDQMSYQEMLDHWSAKHSTWTQNWYMTTDQKVSRL